MQVQMKRAGEDREKQNKAHAPSTEKKRRKKGLHGNMAGVEVKVDFLHLYDVRHIGRMAARNNTQVGTKIQWQMSHRAWNKLMHAIHGNTFQVGGSSSSSGKTRKTNESHHALVTGLQTERGRKLNGKKVWIQSIDKETGRYEVVIEGEPKVILLKQENLENPGPVEMMMNDESDDESIPIGTEKRLTGMHELQDVIEGRNCTIIAYDGYESTYSVMVPGWGTVDGVLLEQLRDRDGNAVRQGIDFEAQDGVRIDEWRWDDAGQLVKKADKAEENWLMLVMLCLEGHIADWAHNNGLSLRLAKASTCIFLAWKLVAIDRMDVRNQRREEPTSCPRGHKLRDFEMDGEKCEQCHAELTGGSKGMTCEGQWCEWTVCEECQLQRHKFLRVPSKAERIKWHRAYCKGKCYHHFGRAACRFGKACKFCHDEVHSL
jgi:hypothetical protein